MQVEDIANQSLDLIGYKRHIGHIYEGTPTARVVLDFWKQTADELLTKEEPDWAKVNSVLQLLKSAPVGGYDPTTPWTQAYPPLPWQYEYAYPADCVHTLQIHVTPNTFPEWRPRYCVYRLAFDNRVRVVLTNAQDAIMTYIGKAFDVDVWEGDFTQKFIPLLASKLAPALAVHQAVGEKKDAGDTAS